MTLIYRPTTAMARATPPTAHPAFPVICDIPAELVLLAAVADDVLILLAAAAVNELV